MNRDPQYDEIDFENASDLVNLRQRFRRRPRRSADLISQMMARQGYSQTRSNIELDEAWKIAVGPSLQSKTKVGRIVRSVMQVHVANSATMNQLSFRKKQLLSAIQQQLPQNQITDIRFKLGNVSNDEHR